MKAIKLSRQFERGQVIVETSVGTRAVGATVKSALEKLDTRAVLGEQTLKELEAFFESIPDTPTGQVVEGRASA